MFWRDFGRYGRPWLSSYSDFDRLQKEMERLFGGLRRPFAPEFPAMNVWTNADGAILTAELPGVSEKDLDISVVGNTLTLRGTRNAPDAESFLRKERDTGTFTRSLELPFRVNAEKVEASLERGILEIGLPRAESDKPHKISVKGA